ncbi:hypothetical protein Poly30_53680 [Planctomycetes bacterium Poly30]|uniref:Endonuclease/exonuclease/phosphatase domain-containing protein n=1 Tax=Saltatorellus ferox TaxID=2528018 RepID=A0A518F0D9_9BACT|nr:hypothetical protein Poly30_53680 [Planctomycetes bacterium Poly30]
MRSRRSETATPVGQPAPSSGQGPAQEFDPASELCIVSWNVHKLLHDGVHDELQDLVDIRCPHLLALQEARLGMHLPTGMVGHHARSFRSGLLGRSEEGVMTLSSVAASNAYRVRSAERELRVLTPKAALVSLFRVAGGGELCLVNLHGLNFDPSGAQLARQLEALRVRVEAFRGPMIVAGDFNTWNKARMDAVEALSHALDLEEVRPDYPGGKTGDVPAGVVSRAIGFSPDLHLDRIFVRGFRPIQVSWMLEYEASDHVPILARLEWT